jgi:hypothetical protein
MGMPVDDKNFLALGRSVHGVSPAPARIGLAVGVAGLASPGWLGQHTRRPSLVCSDLQTMYFIISFMSPNSMTVLSSVMTMRP